jgi:hypothetical protein
MSMIIKIEYCWYEKLNQYCIYIYLKDGSCMTYYLSKSNFIELKDTL